MAPAATLPGPAWPGRNPHRGRWAALCAVLALHALLLWWLAQAAAPRPQGRPAAVDRPEARMRWITVPPTPLQEPDRAPPPHAGPASFDKPAGRTDRRQAPAAPAATARPPTVGDDGDQAATRDAPAAPAAPSTQETPATAPPLDLRLPPSGWRSAPGDAPGSGASVRGQALNDPRSNSPHPPRLEERIFNATTRNDKLQEEDRGPGRRRVRMNGRCHDVHQARIAQIDPMNEVSARALPGLAPCRGE